MADLAGFNANEVPPNEGFGLIPRGDYDAVIIDSEKKLTKNGKGHYLALTFQICSGEYQNRRLFENLNLWNESTEAVQIAKGNLSAICRAVGVPTPGDSSELHNKPLKISVAIKKEDEERNRIVGFKPRNAGPAAPTEAQKTNQEAVATAPW
jgi:hypothetical protein